MKWHWIIMLGAGVLSGCQNVREEVRDFLSSEEKPGPLSKEDEEKKESYFTKDENRPGLFSGEKGYFDITPGGQDSDLPGSKKARAKKGASGAPRPEPSDLEKQAASRS
ncbi:MAG: hypothetical protein LCH26_04010 [Proteobacteria bacterium]|nr:hypothetical protein [Pseudomonadota bacterium]